MSKLFNAALHELCEARTHFEDEFVIACEGTASVAVKAALELKHVNEQIALVQETWASVSDKVKDRLWLAELKADGIIK